MSRPEIESVIAHELGHYRRRHIWKGIGIGTLEQLFVFWVINLVMKALFPQFLSAQRWNLALLPMFVILTGVVSGLLFGPLGNALSRHFEKAGRSLCPGEHQGEKGVYDRAGRSRR